jgi:hypothetical protein
MATHIPTNFISFAHALTIAVSLDRFGPVWRETRSRKNRKLDLHFSDVITGITPSRPFLANVLRALATSGTPVSLGSVVRTVFC